MDEKSTIELPPIPDHLPGVGEALGWVGHKIDEIEGSSVGRVDGVLVDAEHGNPTWLAIRLGRLGHRTAVPFEFVAAGVGRVWAPYPKELLKAAPEVDPRQGLNPDLERRLCEHYGIPGSARRMAELAEREADGASSVAVSDGPEGS